MVHFKKYSPIISFFRRSLIASGPLKGVSPSFLHEVQRDVASEVRHRVFSQMDDHFSDTDLGSSDDHGTQVIKEVVKVFCTTMVHHHGRLYNERFLNDKETSKRHKLT